MLNGWEHIRELLVFKEIVVDNNLYLCMFVSKSRILKIFLEAIIYFCDRKQ